MYYIYISIYIHRFFNVPPKNQKETNYLIKKWAKDMNTVSKNWKSCSCSLVIRNVQSKASKVGGQFMFWGKTQKLQRMQRMGEKMS